MHFYSKLVFLISFTLATPFFTSRWPDAYECDINPIMPRCCVHVCRIVPELKNEVCIIEDKSCGEPYRFSVLIDEFPACTVYRSGPCIHEAEICVELRKKVFICQTSLSLNFKHRAMEWCFSAYLKVYGIKLYKFSELCAYFAEDYILLPRAVEDLLIDAGY